MRIVILAGGTGSAKLLTGLDRLIDRFTVVSNVGDNIWLYGLYICPDIDIATYCLAGILDNKGWGIKDDTFNALAQLSVLGFPTWFRVGDKDLAVHIIRTKMIREGKRLTDVTKYLTRSLNVKHEVIPCTDSEVTTYIKTDMGSLHLQEFWVREQGKPRVYGIEYKGGEDAEPSPETVKSLQDAERIILCPANPVSSIGPILAIKGMKDAILSSKARKVAISPLVGSSPISGPAGKFMEATGARVDCVGVAKLYEDLIDVLMVNTNDQGFCSEIRSLGIECIPTNIIMKSIEDQVRLAAEVLRV
ncbi:MAG: 2-phospho-L-lactate transferase [Conexivisphaerales archaeon]